MMKIKLIDDWRRSWKFASIQWSSLGFLVMALLEWARDTWSQIPRDTLDMIPHASEIGMFLFLLTLVGRLVKFEKVTPDGGEHN